MLLLTLACAKQTTPTTTTEIPSEAEKAAQDQAAIEAEAAKKAEAWGGLRAHMQEHYAAANKARMAVIHGNMDQMKESAEWLANHHHGEDRHKYPDPWTPHVVELERSASSAADASSLRDAAVSIANLGKACGNCHVALEAKPPFALASQPPVDGPDVKQHMRRHQWAADRMWEGLITPSDELWNAGLMALRDDPAIIQHKGEDGGMVQELSHWVHEIPDLGDMSDEPGDRMAVYASLIGSCSTCHTDIRDEGE